VPALSRLDDRFQAEVKKGRAERFLRPRSIGQQDSRVTVSAGTKIPIMSVATLAVHLPVGDYLEWRWLSSRWDISKMVSTVRVTLLTAAATVI
jgi:hypothetical protein